MIPRDKDARLTISMPWTGRSAPAKRAALRAAGSLAAAATWLVCAGVAQAQVAETVLLNPAYPDGYEAYRQQGVTEQGQGDWAARGIRAGSFEIFPQLRTEVAGTTNAYVSAVRNVATPFVTVSPAVRANSTWSRHYVGLTADADLARYIGQSRRNENNWEIAATGKLDVSSSFSVTGEAQANQITLNRFSGELTVDAAAVAAIRQNSASVTAESSFGRGRFIASLEYLDLSFARILLVDGTQSDQSARNHSVMRASSQAEYSFTPALTVFAQMAYVRFDYRRPTTPSISTSDSDGVRAVGGVRYEIQGLARLTVAAGYSRRTYDVGGIGAIGRFTAEGRAEIFPSALTTIRIEAGHRFTDARLIDSSPFLQNYAYGNVSHALRRNFTLGVNGGFQRQSYFASSQVTRIMSLGLTARYLVSPHWELGARLINSNRHTTSRTQDYSIQDTTGGISATFKI